MTVTNSNFLHTELTEKIIGQIYNVYNILGYGFLEKVYQKALKKKLLDIGLEVEEEYPVKVYFEGEVIGDYFADLLVENKIIIELKAIENLNQIHEVQLVNYLKATGIEVGLLVNFGKKVEIKRRVLSVNHSIS